MGIKSWIAGAAVAFLVGGALPANAAIINWTLANVRFDDGGAMFGTFSTDSTNGAVTAFDVTTTPTAIWAGAVYDSTTYFAYGPPAFSGAPNGFALLTVFDLPTWVHLAFVNPLTSGGVVPFLVAGPVSSREADYNSDAVRKVVRGVAVSDGFSVPAGVPEPTTWALMLVGFAGLGAVMQSSRRRLTAATA